MLNLLVAAAIDVLVTVPFPGGARAHTDRLYPGSLAGRVVRLNTTQIVSGHTALNDLRSSSLSSHPVVSTSSP